MYCVLTLAKVSVFSCECLCLSDCRSSLCKESSLNWQQEAVEIPLTSVLTTKMYSLFQHSWVKRLRDKFKKFRSRSKELTGKDCIQEMKAKYGRKRISAASTNPDEVEQLVKVQRILVSYVNILNISSDW